MSKYIKLEGAKAAIREKFKSFEDRVEINGVLNNLPTLDVREYADKDQAYLDGYAKGVVYGGLLKLGVGEDALAKIADLPTIEVSEDMDYCNNCPYISYNGDCISKAWLLNELDVWGCDGCDIGENLVISIKNAPSVVPKQVTGKLESVEISTSEGEESTMSQPKSKLAPTMISRDDVLDYINDHINDFKGYNEYSCAFDYFDTL